MTVRGVEFRATPERDLVNAIREILGMEPIYEEQRRTEAVRFYADYSSRSGQIYRRPRAE